jgi:nucleotide-binding universal stress UspA family protein
MGEWIPRIEAYESRLGEIADEAGVRFTGSMQDARKTSAVKSEPLFTYAFDGSKTFTDRETASYARVFDLIIIGRPDKGEGKPRISCAETLLLESGRPILLAPPEASTSLGETVVIAWNQSMESARAIAYAMPFLKRAKKVYILTIEAHNVEGPSAEQLGSKLALHGIFPEIVHKMGKNRAAGVAYLEDAAALGSDLMVKGAYTQSRLREMIFGGATGHILTHAKMPILMAN